MLKFVEDNGHIVGAVQVIDDEDGEADNGMTIEEAMEEIIKFKRTRYKDDNTSDFSQALSIAFLTMKNYQLLKSSYNDKLKADMVAMLTEIQLEIEELDPSGNEWSDSLDACNDVIQQKIDKLRGEESG